MSDVIAQIPYGFEVVTLVVAIAGLVSAIVPDDKMPPKLAAVLNFLALNFGNARNAPRT